MPDIKRKQYYFDDSYCVCKAAPGLDPKVTPLKELKVGARFVACCESKKVAQHIANALNAWVPLKERQAIERNERKQTIIKNFTPRIR